MNVGCGDRSLANRDAELIQFERHVSDCIKMLNRRALLFIDVKASVLIAAGAELDRKL
jgi:hypothetical protein